MVYIERIFSSGQALSSNEVRNFCRRVELSFFEIWHIMKDPWLLSVPRVTRMHAHESVRVISLLPMESTNGLEVKKKSPYEIRWVCRFRSRCHPHRDDPVMLPCTVLFFLTCGGDERSPYL